MTKNIRRVTVLLILAATLFLSIVFLLRKSAEGVVPDELPVTQRAEDSGKPLTLFIESGRNALVSEPAVVSSFDSPEQLEQLRLQVLHSGSYLSLQRRCQDFRASGLDTTVNADAAKRLLLEAYPETIDQKSAAKRVLALHLLRYSEHLRNEDCLILLSSLIDQYQFASSNMHLRAIQFDVGSVAYMCAPIGDETFFSVVESLPVLSLKAQCKNAMTVYGEDEARGSGF